MTTMKPRPRIPALPLLLAAIGAGAAPAARAGVDINETIPTGTTIINASPLSLTADGTSSITYRIADGGVLIIQNGATTGGNGGIYYMNTMGLVDIAPATPAGTGTVIFQNNYAANGGALYIANSGTIRLENALFRSNTVATTAGALFGNTQGSVVILKNVVFENNTASFAVGALRFGGTTIMTGGGFSGNIGRDYGATDMKFTGTPKIELTDVYFTNNRGYWAGAIGTETSASRVWDMTLTNVTFNNNWAIYQGGALYVGISDTTTFVLNAGAGATEYNYTGNVAGGTVISSVTARMAPLLAGVAPTAVARAGGFFYADRAAIAEFDIDAGVSLAIGAGAGAGAAAGADSLASSGSYGTPEIRKNGAGLLVLNADNSYWQGAVNINSGTLLLGHAGAKLGGAVTVAAGAVFGGAGALETRNQAGALTAATALTMQAGSTLQIGAGAASAATLTIGGTLTLAAGATLEFDTFGAASSDKISAAALNILGTGTIRLGSLISGTCTLLEWSAATGIAEGDIPAWNAALIHNAPVTRNPSAVLSLSGATLQLTASLDNAALTWTGAAGNIWDHAAENWIEADSFADGDDAIFTAGAGNRNIMISDGEVRARSMTVAGADDYTFTGDTIISTGTLLKTGAGALIFVNTANTFAGGIALDGGALAFTSGAQLATGAGAAPVQIGAGTLRALATTTLATPLNINNAAAALDVPDAAHALTLAAPVTGDDAAALYKTGDGTLVLGAGADLAGFSGTLAARAGTLRISGAPAIANTAIRANNAALEIAAHGAIIKNIAIDNGALVFANLAALPEGAAMLTIPEGGSLDIANSSTIAFAGSRLVTGRSYALIRPENARAVSLGADTVFDLGSQNASLDITAPYINPVSGDLIITGIDQAVAPGKDVAAIFDALTAAANVIGARAGESLYQDNNIGRARPPGAPTPPAARLWLRGFGSFGDYDRHGATIAHRDHSYGALAGAEHVLKNNKVLFGAVAGYVSTGIDTGTGAKTLARQPLAGLYSALRAGRFHLAADLMSGRLDADSTRREGEGFVSGNYKADTLSGGVTLGARFNLWKNGAAQPFISARYSRFAFGGHDETGTGAVLLDDFSTSRWQGLAAIRVAHAFGRAGAGDDIKPAFAKGDMLNFATGEFSLLAGRRFLISGGDTAVRGIFRESLMDFTSRCDAVDAGALVLGGALALDLTRAAALTLRYDCELGSNHSRHDISATLGWSW
jgi:autotransporter-associated beta strand protein